MTNINKLIEEIETKCYDAPSVGIALDRVGEIIHKHLDGYALVPKVKCPFESLYCTLAFATKDWSVDKNDAWLYGIIAGWDDDSLKELQLKFKWPDRSIKELKGLHSTYKAMITAKGES